MGAATLTFTLATNGSWFDGKREHAVGTLVVSASPDTYTTGGLDISTAFKSKVRGVGTNQPQDIQIDSTLGTPVGWDRVNKKLLIFTSTNTNTQITGGAAIPAAVSGDTFNVHAVFRST